jgi:hypothetical protein
MELVILQLFIQTGADLSFQTVKVEIQNLNCVRHWARKIKLKQEEALHTRPKRFCLCCGSVFSQVDSSSVEMLLLFSTFQFELPINCTVATCRFPLPLPGDTRCHLNAPHPHLERRSTLLLWRAGKCLGSETSSECYLFCFAILWDCVLYEMCVCVCVCIVIVVRNCVSM